MIVIHAAQKLMNTSRIEPRIQISVPGEGQMLQHWYAKLIPSTERRRMLTLYVHEPSKMAVVCKGKTIQKTWPEFVDRLRELLEYFAFPEAFITNEMAFTDTYVVSKSTNKSMVATLNQISYELEYPISIHDGEILETKLELWLMKRRFMDRSAKWGYSSPFEYWQKVFGRV